MSLKTFLYLCRLGLKNTWRNKVYTIASVVTMSACIFLFGLFYLVVLNVNTAIRNTEKDVAVVVFFDEDVKDGRVDEIGELLRARPEVTDTVYTSAEEAWNSLRDTYYEGENLLEGIFENDNPLEHSNNYKVFLKDVESQEEFVAYVEQLDGVRSVRNSADTVKAMLKIKNTISAITGGSVAVIVLMSALLIYNTLAVGIAAQRDKTQAMLLMGARDIFIKIPFIIEGLIMGLAGMALPIVILYFTYRWGTEFAVTQLHLFGEGIRLLPLRLVFPGVLRACAAVGILSGCLGSIFAMRRLKR